MSVCMYLQSGDEATLLRLASEPGALQALAAVAASSAATAVPEPPILRRAALLEQQLERLDRETRGRSLISSIDLFFRRRSTRRAIGRMRAISTELRSEATAVAALSLHDIWQLLNHLVAEAAGRVDGAAATLVAGGRLVGGDLEHDRARLIDPVATRDFARVLEPVTIESLQSRIDVGHLNRLGLSSMADGSGTIEGLRDSIADHFPRLNAYVQSTAIRGESLLIWCV